MKDLLRLRIGDLKTEAAEVAEFVGVSLSDLTRMALREKIEKEQPRLKKSRKNHKPTEEAAQ